MKLLKHIIRAGALCGLLLTTAAAKAQTVQLKVLDWNVLSFEMTDKSNQIEFIVDEYVDLIKAQNPDIVCINELETGTSRMGKEKLTELASRLDMYPYFIMSYPKDVGFYGNGILSKYPIVSSFSALHPYKHAKGEGNYQWNTGYEYYLYGYDQRSMGYIDILVPTSDSDGQIVRIICTHFDHCGIDQVIQQQEQNVVTQAGLNNPEYPTILMGDLNVGWGTNVLPEFRNLGDHIGVSWVDHIFAFPKGRWTGHDFKSHSCPAANGKASLSDHDPITATLVLK